MTKLINHRHETALVGRWHDYANLFPMLDDAAHDRLRSDVHVYGVREPIVIFEGSILDGRNRYLAARDLGIDFPVADFSGSRAEALAYVLSTNLHRRHLTESQRAAVAAKLANLERGRPTEEINPPIGGITAKAAADMMSVGTRSVERARVVQEQGAPELMAAVESGQVTVAAAETLTALPQEEQAAVVAEGPQAVRAKAKELRAVRVEPQGEAVEPPADPYGYARLTEAALLDLANGLRADLDDEKARRKKAEAENKRLRESLADFDGDQADTIRRLQKQIDHLRSEMFRANEKTDAALRQAHAVRKEAHGLRQQVENQIIPLGGAA